MKLQKIIFTIIFLIAPYLFYAQAESIFNGVKLNESLEKTVKKLNEISKTIDTISVEHPNFPLAKLKEEHLVCSQVKTGNGIIDKVVFTFADDTLKYIEVRGNVQKVFASKRIDT
ncbi:MAG: hypothetical protein KC469_10170, partial [Flavobacteriaceae bacterium]|nr:hypothetical protein [Flavobacteriaceae bacterium]